MLCFIGMSVPIEALTGFLTRLGTLARVLPWGMAHNPPWIVVDVVIQDEYTHDVILGNVGDSRAIVLDCT